MTPNVFVVSHPLVQHKLSTMRRKETGSADFRRLLKEISALLAYEATRDLEVGKIEIETPMTKMLAPHVNEDRLVIISILRAGNGILDGILEIVPHARVGHIGLYRDHDTLQAVEYYFKVPDQVQGGDLLMVDPMLATGNSAVAALTRLKGLAPRSIKFLCLIAAPEGIEVLHKAHPDVPVYTASVDERLNELGYIMPGLGDAGDRLFGTK